MLAPVFVDNIAVRRCNYPSSSILLNLDSVDIQADKCVHARVTHRRYTPVSVLFKEKCDMSVAYAYMHTSNQTILTQSFWSSKDRVADGVTV